MRITTKKKMLYNSIKMSNWLQPLTTVELNKLLEIESFKVNVREWSQISEIPVEELNRDYVMEILDAWYPVTHSNQSSLEYYQCNVQSIHNDANDVSKIWEILDLQNSILSRFKEIFTLQPVLSCNKKLSMICCITIAPPPELDPMILVNFVIKKCRCEGVKSFFGVFEKGKGENFHTHLVLSYSNKNVPQNLIKSIPSFNSIKWVYKNEYLNNMKDLRKSINYMCSKEKDNYGVIGRDNLSYFIELANYNFKIKFQEKQDNYNIL